MKDVLLQAAPEKTKKKKEAADRAMQERWEEGKPAVASFSQEKEKQCMPGISETRFLWTGDRTVALSERRQRRRANKRLLRKVREARLRLK
jgi:hypothetical protein